MVDNWAQRQCRIWYSPFEASFKEQNCTRATQVQLASNTEGCQCSSPHWQCIGCTCCAVHITPDRHKVLSQATV